MLARYTPTPVISLSLVDGDHSTFGGDVANGQKMPSFRKDLAFFFDIDGTLADIAPSPNDALIPYTTLNNLHFLQKKSAVALISGRSLVSIDALTYPLQFPAAGQHGLEIRFSDDEIIHLTHHKPVMDAINKEVKAFADQYPDLVVEYKGLSVAIHYRQAPALAGTVRSFAMSFVKPCENILCVHRGKMVEEIKLCGGNKGAAIRAFMQRDEFQGKIPVFAGDDKTDEDAYEAVNQLGGISIQIGSSSRQAHFSLHTPQNLRVWLDDIVTNWEEQR